MAWDYSLIENSHLGEALLYKALEETRGRCAPGLKRDVRDHKGKVEKARLAVTTGHFASDWDRITTKGIVNYEAGQMMVLVPMEGTTEGKSDYNLRPDGYATFAEAAASNPGARYKLLIEALFFRCAYLAPDLVEKAFREHPNLRTAAQIGTPIAIRLATKVASGGANVGAAAGGLSGGLFDMGLETATDMAGGAAMEFATDLGNVRNAKDRHKAGAAVVEVKKSKGLTTNRALICELENPHKRDALGVSVPHRIVVFQVTPLRYTVEAGSQTRRVAAFHKSVMGVRAFTEIEWEAVTGDVKRVSALKYQQVYDEANKNPIRAAIFLVDKGRFERLMDEPTYYLRDGTIDSAHLSEEGTTNPGANVFEGHYVPWQSSAALRTMATTASKVTSKAAGR